MKRKLLALLLALVMVLALLPATFAPTTVAVADGQTVQNGNESSPVTGGAILHCFNWSYNEIKAHMAEIADAGYTAVQTSPVQPPKDYNSAWDNTKGGWWKFYQPIGIRIADGQTWLGTRAELKAMCDEAEKYHVSVIVDVVANHLANITDGGYKLPNGTLNLSPQVDADLTDPEYYHQETDGINYYNDTDRYNITHKHMNMPDLDTGELYIQQSFLAFLKDCVDCGVDGFRFDAAKHIELPSDPDGTKSGFWSYILEGKDVDGNKVTTGIREYKPGLFIYGEILGFVGTHVQNYTKYMAVTDNVSGNRARGAVLDMNAGALADGRYQKYVDYFGNDFAEPNHCVLWAESHDTYEDNSTSGVANADIVKTWAIVGARANSTALYFARPNNVLGKASTDETWKSTAVAEVNKFKNHFDGTGEWLGYNQDNQYAYAYILRGDSVSAGIVIDNLKGAGGIEITLPTDANAPRMADGTYKDEVSGNIFTVADGKIKGYVNTTGVAVVYNKTTATQPTIAGGTQLYLKPASNWLNDGARIAACFFDNSNYNSWVSMTANSDGYYPVTAPEGNWAGVIFCRMVGSNSSFEWGATWNQTSNLMPDEGKDCFTVKEGTWDYGGGTWSTYGTDNGFYVVGTMNSWSLDPAYKMTQVGNTTEYNAEVELMTNSQFKVVWSPDGITRQTWYPGGNNYGYKEQDTDPDIITADGIYRVRFDSNGGQNGWHEGYITIEQTEYAIKVNSADKNGTVTVNKDRAAANTEITLTVKPNKGYVLDTVTVTKASGGPVEVNNNTFTMPEENVTVKATFKALPRFESCSVVLSGQIGMNFYMTIPEEYISTNTNPEVTFTIATDEKSRTTTAIGKKLDDGRYRFTCYLTSVEMTDQITAVYNYEVDGEPKTASMETSIQGYLNKIIENKENDPEFTRAKDLAKALWTYGYYAHDAVTDGPNHVQMNIGNVNVINEYPSIDGFDLDAYKGSEVAKITYSLSLDSETALNIYLTPAEGVAFTKDNVIVRKGTEIEIYENYIVEKVGARYRVKITGIGAHELGTGFNVDVGTRANTTISNVSVVSIVKKYLNPENTTIKDATKKAATALYYYYQAAIAYSEG
jgi:hypothetical protein